MLHATLDIRHRAVDPETVRQRFIAVFGQDDRGLLAESAVFQAHQEVWGPRVAYAGRTAAYLVLHLTDTNRESEVVLEPLGTRVHPACENGWYSLRKGWYNR